MRNISRLCFRKSWSDHDGMCKSNDTGISLSCLLSICFDLSVCLFLLHHMSSLAMSEFLYFYSIQCRTYYLIINYACWYVLVCMCVTMNTFPDVLVQTAMLELLLTLLFFEMWLWKSFTCVLLNKYILTERNSFLSILLYLYLKTAVWLAVLWQGFFFWLPKSDLLISLGIMGS